MSEVKAIPTTEVNVRKQNIDHFPIEDDLGLFGTGGNQNLKPGLFQGLCCRSTIRQIVLDYENAGEAYLWGRTLGSRSAAPELWDRDHACGLPSWTSVS
jgi:hypothetical protein